VAERVDAQGIIAAFLEQSSRHLFGPTSQPSAPPKSQVISVSSLIDKLDHLKPEDLSLIRRAFQYSDNAHLGNIANRVSLTLLIHSLSLNYVLTGS